MEGRERKCSICELDSVMEACRGAVGEKSERGRWGFSEGMGEEEEKRGRRLAYKVVSRLEE